MSETEKKYPQGYWTATGISIGLAIGVAMGLIFNNIGIGMAIGIAIGAGIGASLEQKNKDNIRSLTEQEQKRQKWGVVIGLALTGILFLALVIVYFVSAG